MNRKLAFFGVLIAVPSLAIGQVADAKARDSSRSMSEFDVVGAAIVNDNGQGYVEAYGTATDSYVGAFQFDGSIICNDDDPENPLYTNYSYSSYDYDGIAPAQSFTIERQNASAFVQGDVMVEYYIDNQCGESEGGQGVLSVTMDLGSNGVRLRNTQTTTSSGPDGSTTEKWSFTGVGATGTVVVTGMVDDSELTVADGQIGTAKTTSTNRSR